MWNQCPKLIEEPELELTTLSFMPLETELYYRNLQLYQ